MTIVAATPATVNLLDIIKAALRRVTKTGGLGEEPSQDQFDTCMQELNMIIAQIQGQKDYGQGFKMWSRKRAYIFLQKDQGTYVLGPGGDEATPSFTRTTISSTEAAAQTVLSVTSSAGMIADDAIGILLDSGTMQWTTIGATGAGTVTVNAALTGQASAGNTVYFYTRGISRPLEILTAARYNANSVETQLDRMDLYAYEGLSNKTADGSPTAYYYEQKVRTGNFNIDYQPTNLNEVIRIVYLAPIEEFDDADDTPDFPAEWHMALVDRLAYRIWPEYRAGERPQWLAADALESFTIAARAVPENDYSFFQPGL